MVNINLIYQPRKVAHADCHYDGPEGKVWLNRTYNINMHNVGMSFYSLHGARNPTDSLYVIEPRCVIEKDYNHGFSKQFKFVFSWAAKAFENQPNFIEVNHPSCKGPPGKKFLDEKWSVPWNERKNEIVFIANNKVSHHASALYRLRVMIADIIHKQGKLKVSWYGKMKLKKPYFKGPIKHKAEALSLAKFCVCSENSYDKVWSHNYFTEKMPEAWFCGAVPIYMGCYNIDDFGFAKESYIDLRQYVKKDGKSIHVNGNALSRDLLNYSPENYNKCRKAFFENIEKPDGLYHIIDYDRVYKKMLEAFNNLKAT